MAMFDETAENFRDFKIFLWENFASAVARAEIATLHKINDEDRGAYGYVVLFRRDLTDEEVQKFPLHFNGVPVASHVIKSGAPPTAEMS